ncbi:MAG TPA: exodeoxyribonuclease III [Candidatus Onthousia faecigallinarum]|nr:exodeoxyribonuclease III [Candidatus Onthousia faecigallinarum]
MKIISWNVAGLRACLKKGFADFFQESKADIYCLQETKLLEEQLTFHQEGYFEYLNPAERKGYSGTMIYTKKKPLSVTYGINIEKHDQEGRVITLEYKDFYLVTVYTPNAKRGLERLDYRMEWEDDFKNYLKELDQKKPVVVCGDLNVAHEEIDLKNPKANIGNAGFTYEERNKMTDLLNAGFIDTFRYFHPNEENHYTWWSYMGNARSKNIGWRIDYFLVSERIIDKVKDTMIYQDVYGSDHCPIGISLELD